MAEEPQERFELDESSKEAIRKLVAEAPRPTEEQMAKLRRMMRPGFEAAAKRLAAEEQNDQQ